LRNSLLVFCILGIALLVIATQITIFVIQPIGALPDGVTVILLRKGQLKFVDSPDAICARKMGGVSLICRGMTAGIVAKESTIIARLPFIPWLYDLSTGGVAYEK
jgi:hypothetical protein